MLGAPRNAQDENGVRPRRKSYDVALGPGQGGQPRAKRLQTSGSLLVVLLVITFVVRILFVAVGDSNDAVQPTFDLFVVVTGGSANSSCKSALVLAGVYFARVALLLKGFSTIDAPRCSAYSAAFMSSNSSAASSFPIRRKNSTACRRLVSASPKVIRFMSRSGYGGWLLTLLLPTFVGMTLTGLTLRHGVQEPILIALVRVSGPWLWEVGQGE